MINVLYSGCIPDPWLDVAKKLKKENNLNPVYWVGWDNYDLSINIRKEINDNFQNCIFHDLSVAWKAIFPEEVKAINPEPLDAKLIDKVASNEIIALKMMDRLDPDRESFYFEERQRHFRKLLSKWLGIIDHLNIKLFISPSIPHRVFDYALYLACKIKEVKTLMYKMTPFQDILVPIDDINYMPNNVLLSFNEIKERKIDVFLPKKIINSINVLKKSYREAEPEYMKLQKRTNYTSIYRLLYKNIKKLRTIFNIKKLFKSTNHYHKVHGEKMEEIFPKLYQSQMFAICGIKYKNRLKKYYESFCTRVNLENEKYIFVALHYQPEETTSPSAGHYVNQQLIIENLAEIIPDEIQIVVKEHSSQFHPKMEGHTGRTKVFYDDLLKIQGVKLVSSEDSSFNYIDNALAVATATGTIGWEAIVRGVPVLIFGNAWYEYCDNVYRIYSKQDLKKALNQIRSESKNAADYMSYAKAIYKNAIEAYHYKGCDKKSLINKNTSVNNLSTSIIKFLDSQKALSS